MAGDNENAEVRLIYEYQLKSIEDAKRRQWTAIYYVFLSYAAIIAFYHLTRGDLSIVCPQQKAFFLIPAFIVNTFGIWFLLEIQKNLFTYRIRTVAIEKILSSKAQEI